MWQTKTFRCVLYSKPPQRQSVRARPSCLFQPICQTLLRFTSHSSDYLKSPSSIMPKRTSTASPAEEEDDDHKPTSLALQSPKKPKTKGCSEALNSPSKPSKTVSPNSIQTFNFYFSLTLSSKRLTPPSLQRWSPDEDTILINLLEQVIKKDLWAAVKAEGSLVHRTNYGVQYHAMVCPVSSNLLSQASSKIW